MGDRVVRGHRPRRALLRLVPTAGSILLSLAMASCASFTYTDSDHMRHTIGFVDLETPQSTSGVSGDAVTVTTIGIALRQGDNSSNGVTLGYDSETLVSFANGACLDLQTGGVCATKFADQNLKGATKP